MQTQRLFQQEADSGSAIHAITTPAVKTLLQIWG